MISMREIADIDSKVSSTRWAFAAIVKADIFIVFIAIAAGLVGHFIDKPLDKSFYDYVAKAVGLLTGILTLAKAAQGFEPHHKEEIKKEKEEEKKEEMLQ